MTRNRFVMPAGIAASLLRLRRVPRATSTWSTCVPIAATAALAATALAAGLPAAQASVSPVRGGPVRAGAVLAHPGPGARHGFRAACPVARPGHARCLLYTRVAADITATIESGELAPGTRLRSERDLAAHYEVAYHTVRRAMEVLRERGLIVSIHGRGTFVREPPPPGP